MPEKTEIDHQKKREETNRCQPRLSTSEFTHCPCLSLSIETELISKAHYQK